MEYYDEDPAEAEGLGFSFFFTRDEDDRDYEEYDSWGIRD